MRIATACIVLAALYSAVLWTCRLLRRRQVLVLNDLGFKLSSSKSELVLWSSVKKLSVVRYKRRPYYLSLVLDREAARSLVPGVGRSILQKIGLARRTRLLINLRWLDRKSNEIVRLFEAHCAHVLPPVDPVAERAELALSRQPWAAYALTGLLAAIFAAEFALRLNKTTSGLDFSAVTLWALGASSRLTVVTDAQWWRLATSPLLHGGALHLILNVIALWFAARLLERMIGWRWFLGTFAVSAFCGSAFSMLLHQPNQLTVGASGGIVGLSAATAVLAFHFASGSMRRRLILGSLQILLPSILPLAQRIGTARIDFAAHGGGAVGGSVMGLIMLAAWPRSALVPRFGRLGIGCAAVFIIVALVGATQVPATYRQGEALAALATTFPAPATAVPRGAQLVSTFPRDPRAHAALAELLAQHGNVAAAQSELARALDLNHDLPKGALPNFEGYLRAREAQLMVGQGRGAEAAALVAPICADVVGSLKVALSQMALCH